MRSWSAGTLIAPAAVPFTLSTVDSPVACSRRILPEASPTARSRDRGEAASAVIAACPPGDTGGKVFAAVIRSPSTAVASSARVAKKIRTSPAVSPTASALPPKSRATATTSAEPGATSKVSISTGSSIERMACRRAEPSPSITNTWSPSSDTRTNLALLPRGPPAAASASSAPSAGGSIVAPDDVATTSSVSRLRREEIVSTRTRPRSSSAATSGPAVRIVMSTSITRASSDRDGSAARSVTRLMRA